MEYNGGVLSCFDDLIEVTDCAFTNGFGQGTIMPLSFTVTDQMSANQVGGGEIIMAGDGI